MKVYLLTLSFLLLVSSSFAQGVGKVSGSIKVKNEATAIPVGATVALLRAKDSATVKFTVLQKDGSYSFEQLSNETYLVAVTSAGYQKSFSPGFEISHEKQAIQVAVIELTELTKSLTGVTVTASRPLIEQKIDRTIVNVDASITNIGTSALEVLEKSPGVSVDRDGNISLKGKEGVLIMVDGRPTQLGGEDLANLLRNMSSNQLDQIEIMTNPPARYDAAGNSGIINIKTKKLITAGSNGSLTIGYTQGRYPKSNEGFNYNYRKNKINFFTNLSHNYHRSFGVLKFKRNIYNNTSNSLENIFDQRADRNMEGNSYSAKLGLDFFATKKTTYGIVFNGNTRSMESNNLNLTHISTASKNLESITKATVNNNNTWNNISTNLYFRTLLDKNGRELTADLDFLKYGSANELFMVNSYSDATGNDFKKADTLTGHLPQDIKVYSGRMDYIHPLKKNAKFEAGIKSSIVRTDNNAIYDSIQFGRTIRDHNRSNHFLYEENINAAYVNLSTPLSKKISAQFGLRLENTNAKGKQLTTGENFDRNYTQLFPTAYFQYKLNEDHNLGANFGRRVRRPNYQSLNPFINFIDRYTFSQGNPNLKPSLSNNFEVSHTWKNKITTTLNYTTTKDIIESVIEQKGEVAYNTPSNIASLRQYGISINANTPINKWWTSSININAFNNNFKGVVSNTPVDLATTSFIIIGTQQFKITKTLTGEINGRYRNGWLEGVLRARSVGFIGAGLSKQLFKNQGTLRLSVRDIFYTQKFRGTAKYGNVDFEMQQYGESRVVSAGFSYRFSKGKKIAPVKRTSGSANEEQERIGN